MNKPTLAFNTYNLNIIRDETITKCVLDNIDILTINKIADLLGISIRTLFREMNRLNLKEKYKYGTSKER